MSALRLAIAVLVGFAGSAAAAPGLTADASADALVDPSADAPPTARPVPASSRHVTDVALAVNPPFRWASDYERAVGVSGYLGLGRHHAIRGNVASYDYAPNIVGELISIAAGGDGSEAWYQGRVTDVGVAWMYFPRRLWSGATLELGLVRRARDVSLEDEFATPERIETQTTTYAGRALVGWSWLMFDRVFISFQTGASIGYERGHETTIPRVYPYDMQMATTREVGRRDLALEGFLRVGIRFGR